MPLGRDPALHVAAECSPPAVVAAMAAAASDADVMSDGRSPLWLAVHSRRHDNARVLAAAGADPWRPMMTGWSPGGSLAGPEPDLFGAAPAGVELSPVEREAVALAGELGDRLQVDYYDGTGLLCVAGIDSIEAISRLDGIPMTEDELLVHYDVDVDDEPEPGDEGDWGWLAEMDDLLLVGVTDVPGGCVITQPWGYQPQTPPGRSAAVRRHRRLRLVREPEKRQPGQHLLRWADDRLGPAPWRSPCGTPTPARWSCSATSTGCRPPHTRARS